MPPEEKLPNICIDTDFTHHPKFAEFCSILDLEEDFCELLVERLWCLTGRSRPDGDLGKINPKWLARELGWRSEWGDPLALIKAFHSAGYLEAYPLDDTEAVDAVGRPQDQGGMDWTRVGFRVHNWYERQPLLRRRLQDRFRKSLDDNSPKKLSTSYQHKPDLSTYYQQSSVKKEKNSAGIPHGASGLPHGASGTKSVSDDKTTAVQNSTRNERTSTRSERNSAPKLLTKVTKERQAGGNTRVVSTTNARARASKDKQPASPPASQSLSPPPPSAAGSPPARPPARRPDFKNIALSPVQVESMAVAVSDTIEGVIVHLRDFDQKMLRGELEAPRGDPYTNLLRLLESRYQARP